MDAHKNRILYFDFLRGIAIMLVVSIHTMPTCTFNTFGECFQIFLRQFTNCAVPIFIAISGYFLGVKSFEEKGSAVTFWKKQIPKIYLPMIVWSMAFFLSAKNIFPHDIQLIMLFLGGYNIYYFIILMVQCYLLLPCLKNITQTKVFAAFGISLICAAIITWYAGIQGRQIYGVIELGPIPILGSYFLLGIYLRRNGRNYSLLLPSIGVIAGIILEMAECIYLHRICGWGIGMKISTFIFSPAAILLLFSQKLEDKYDETKSMILRAIRQIGDISFGIYLSHIYLLILVKRIGLESLEWFPKWSLVLFMTCLIIYVFKKIFPRFSKVVLGFW